MRTGYRSLRRFVLNATQKYSENAQRSTAETDETGFWRFCHYATGEFSQSWLNSVWLELAGHFW
jgi:hypothetical protein